MDTQESIGDYDAYNTPSELVLATIVDQYEQNLVKVREGELYKWEAAAQFQQHWDLAAEDFAIMLNTALAKTDNLLMSSMYYAKGMMEQLVEHNPEAVRTAFVRLFDETLPLADRMAEFASSMDEQLAQLNEAREEAGIAPANNHYQDAHAMSVYLALAKDSKHYIYKMAPYMSFAAYTGVETPANKYEKVVAYEVLCNTLREYLLAKRPDLIQKSDSLLTPQLQEGDTHHHMLAQDIVFFANWGVARNWAYSPGEQATYWEEFRDGGIMAIGWDSLGDPSHFAKKQDLKDAISAAYGTTNPRNDTETIWSFMHEMKPGDIVWARRGKNEVVGCGVVTSEYRYEENREHDRNVRSVAWQELAPFETEGNFTIRTLYELTEKTSVTLSELEEHAPMVAELAAADASLPTLAAEADAPSLSQSADGERRYWWLNANPKIWSFTDLEPGVEQTYTIRTDNGNFRRVHANYVAAKQGDLVIGYDASPTLRIESLCEISRDTDDENLYFKKIKDFDSHLTFKQIKEDEVLAQMQFVQNPNGSLFALTKKEFDHIMELLEGEDDDAALPTSHAEAYTDADFLAEVYVTPQDLATMKRILERKKNLILQGAPGTGKTFCAKRLAWAFMGERDNSRICFMQFHQNTTYDDVMAGYRPAEGGGFEAVPGEFLRFCDKAAQDPEGRPWFFIIDEINRANISKVFGELLMLIEAAHRDEAVKLPLLGRSVKVPSNLYLIGMMNTADRGLALIDYALRRRFSFFEMDPAFENEHFKTYLASIGNEKLSQLAQIVAQVNEELAHDPSFGSGFRIGHSYFCLADPVEDADVADVVEFELAPLIREYYFDAPTKAEALIAKFESVL